MNGFVNKPMKAMAGLCPCCGRLILYLRKIPPEGVLPENYYRTIRCFPEGWDGNLWYTGQVRPHPWTRDFKRAIFGDPVVSELRLD